MDLFGPRRTPQPLTASNSVLINTPEGERIVKRATLELGSEIEQAISKAIHRGELVESEVAAEIRPLLHILNDGPWPYS